MGWFQPGSGKAEPWQRQPLGRGRAGVHLCQKMNRLPREGSLLPAWAQGRDVRRKNKSRSLPYCCVSITPKKSPIKPLECCSFTQRLPSSRLLAGMDWLVPILYKEQQTSLRKALGPPQIRTRRPHRAGLASSRLFRNSGHLIRPRLGWLAGVGVFLIRRAAMVPKDFGKYGYYPAGALDMIGALPISYAD